MIQGAQIKPEQYVPLMKAIQQASEYALWIGIPEFTLDLADPLVMQSTITNMNKSLKAAGMKTDCIFYAAHSLGGTVLQSYVKSNPKGVVWHYTVWLLHK